MMKNHYTTRRKAATLLLGLLALTDVQAQSIDELEPEEKTKKPSVCTVFVDASPGWITSKVFTPYSSYSWRFGMGHDLGLRVLYPRGYGFSVDWAHFKTTYSNFFEKCKLMQNYIGASFVMGARTGDDGLFTAEYGLGYATYTDGSNAQGGFGMKVAVGLDIKLSPVVGVGINLAHYTSVFSKESDHPYYNDDNYTNGFKRLAINVGLRVYL